MAKFNTGDEVKCTNKSMSYITYGKVYRVTKNTTNDDVWIVDDDGDANFYSEQVFELYTASQTAPQPSIQVGDDITVTGYHADITQCKMYKVITFSGSGNPRIIDDAGDEHDIDINDCHLAVNPHGQRIPAAPKAYTGQYHTPSVTADDEPDEDDYDTAKANRSVTSEGDFQVGAVLVYKDGTPTNETRTVTRCTATCVWFEETYSMPFNPSEFMQEY